MCGINKDIADIIEKNYELTKNLWSQSSASEAEVAKHREEIDHLYSKVNTCNTKIDLIGDTIDTMTENGRAKKDRSRFTTGVAIIAIVLSAVSVAANILVYLNR